MPHVSVRSTMVHDPSRSISLRHGPRTGATLIEVLVVMTILAVSVSIFSGMVVTTARQRSINRETALAAGATRVLIETMRNTPFDEVYARYNADPADDPDGPGTAPGNRFTVQGLQALPGVPGDLVGEVFFPDEEIDLGAGKGEAGPEPIGPAPPPVLDLQLREDSTDESLGMPRDLNGDSIIDVLDHSDDYILLPVALRLEWSGQIGKRQLTVHAILTDFLSAE